MNRKEFFLIKRLASSIVDVIKVQYKNIDFTCCSCLKPSINHLDNTCRQYSMLTGKLFSLKDDYKILFMFFVIDDFSSNSLLFHKCSSLQTIYFNILTSNNKWLHEFFKGYVNIKKQKEIDLMRKVFNNVFSLSLNTINKNEFFFCIFRTFLDFLKYNSTFSNEKYNLIKRIHEYVLNISNDNTFNNIIKVPCIEYEICLRKLKKLS